jgi:hypothetical protein
MTTLATTLSLFVADLDQLDPAQLDYVPQLTALVAWLVDTVEHEGDRAPVLIGLCTTVQDWLKQPQDPERIAGRQSAVSDLLTFARALAEE